MKSVGFVRGQSSPCSFDHPGKDLRAVVDGDDFLILVAEHHSDWFKGQIYDIDFKEHLGPGSGGTKVGRVSSIIFEWAHDTIYMEGDPWHAEIIMKQLQLEECTPLSTPHDRIDPKKPTDGDMKELAKEDSRSYRAIVAQGIARP